MVGACCLMNHLAFIAHRRRHVNHQPHDANDLRHHLQHEAPRPCPPISDNHHKSKNPTKDHPHQHRRVTPTQTDNDTHQTTRTKSTGHQPWPASSHAAASHKSWRRCKARHLPCETCAPAPPTQTQDQSEPATLASAPCASHKRK